MVWERALPRVAPFFVGAVGWGIVRGRALLAWVALGILGAGPRMTWLVGLRVGFGFPGFGEGVHE
jgi:hypothetical protein